jgi:recombination protein RecA
VPPKPKRAPAPKSAKPARTGNIYLDLATHLSTVTGRVDAKTGAVTLPPAKVLVAGNEEGDPMIRLPGVISTRCETLDAAIGVGGFPMSRLSVLAGGESCGKTTICGLAAAEVQSMMGYCTKCNDYHPGIPIIIDNEFKLDTGYIRSLGVDLRKLLHTSPATVEDSFAIINETILMVLEEHPGVPILAVLDSLNATKSEAEYESDGTSDFTKSNQGGLGASARFMSANIPKLLRTIHQKPVALVFTSQPRELIGQPGRNLIAGGGAPRFYAALAIELYKKAGFWKEGERNIGTITVAKCFKNQVFTPHAETEIGLRWGIGVDYNKTLLDQAARMALINYSPAGGWYEMASDDPDKPIKWQGMKGWHALTSKRPDVLTCLKAQVRAPYTQVFRSEPPEEAQP